MRYSSYVRTIAQQKPLLVGQLGKLEFRHGRACASYENCCDVYIQQQTDGGYTVKARLGSASMTTHLAFVKAGLPIAAVGLHWSEVNSYLDAIEVLP